LLGPWPSLCVPRQVDERRICLPFARSGCQKIQHLWNVLSPQYPLLERAGRGTGILNQLCIDYSLRPHLSSRLTLGGRTLPRKPWDFGDPESHRVYRYLCLHSHFPSLHDRSRFRFAATGTLSYRRVCTRPTASVHGLVPIIFGAIPLDGSAVTHCLNDGCL
jgi:hypothetical protein